MKKSPINYRAAQPADVSPIHSLIKELASFENAIEQVETDPAQLLMDGFSQNPAYQAFVADHNGQVVGFALTFIRYSTWRGKMVYIEDLYVKPEFRSQSIGKELVQLTMKYAKSIGVNFLSLQVLDWNEGAINFYKKFDCELDKEWINAIIKIK